MRWLVVALGIALTATVSIAQPASDPTDASKLEVVKFNWAKERIGWEALHPDLPKRERSSLNEATEADRPGDGPTGSPA